MRSAAVVPGLETVDPIGEHFVHQAVGFVDTSRPHIAAKMREGLRFPDPREWFPEHRFHEGNAPHRHLAVGVHPGPEILQTLILEDCHPWA